MPSRTPAGRLRAPRYCWGPWEQQSSGRAFALATRAEGWADLETENAVRGKADCQELYWGVAWGEAGGQSCPATASSGLFHTLCVPHKLEMGTDRVLWGICTSFSSESHFLPLPAQRAVPPLLSLQTHTTNSQQLRWFYPKPGHCPGQAAHMSARERVFRLTAAEREIATAI